MPNRKGMPQEIKATKLKHGDLVVYSKDNLQCMKWHDKHEIYLLTNIHACTLKDTGRVDSQGTAVVKPECILQYNQMMGSVDRNNQLSKYYSFARKVMKVHKGLQYLNLVVKSSFRLVKWALILQSYDLEIQYVPRSQQLADAFTRL